MIMNNARRLYRFPLHLQLFNGEQEDFEEDSDKAKTNPEETTEDNTDEPVPLTQTNPAQQKKPGLVQRAKNLFSGPPPAIGKERMAELDAASARAGAIAYNTYRQSAKKAAEAREIKEAAKKKAAVDAEAAKIAGKGQTPAGVAGTSENEVEGPFDPFTGEPLPTVDKRGNAVELTPEKQEEMRRLAEEAGLDLGSPATPPVAAEAGNLGNDDNGAPVETRTETPVISWESVPNSESGEPVSLEERLNQLPSSGEMVSQLPDQSEDENLDPEKDPEGFKRMLDLIWDADQKATQEYKTIRESKEIQTVLKLRESAAKAEGKARNASGLFKALAERKARQANKKI